jgi:hypothetical protein
VLSAPRGFRASGAQRSDTLCSEEFHFGRLIAGRLRRASRPGSPERRTFQEVFHVAPLRIARPASLHRSADARAERAVRQDRSGADRGGLPDGEGGDHDPADAKSSSADTKACDYLLDEFSRVTGVAVQMTKEARNVLKQTPIGLNQNITIPPARSTASSRPCCSPTTSSSCTSPTASRASGPSRRCHNAAASGELRNSARLVPESELAQWAQHPATLITTTIDLPSTDVRTLSNSMRSMFTDANTQQIIPVGNSSLIVTGFAGNVAALARLMHAIDDVSRAQMEKVKSEAPRQPVPVK